MDKQSIIADLVKWLLDELQAEGYTLTQTDAISGVDIDIFHNSNRLTVSNVLEKWDIDCGTYEVERVS